MDKEALEAAHEALATAAVVRADLCRRKTPDRERRLHAQLLALSEAREPLRRHLLRAPKATARFFAPDVRAVSREITAERRRLQRMLYGKSGRAGWERPARKKPVPAAHLSGTVNQAEGDLDGIRERLDALERMEPRRYPLSEYFEHRREAEELREEANERRIRIADAQRRVKLSHVFFDNPPNLEKADPKAERVKREFRACERRAARLSSKRYGIPLRPQGPWTREAAIRALYAWSFEHGGRWPKARELPRYSWLPSRGRWGRSESRSFRTPRNARPLPHNPAPPE